MAPRKQKPYVCECGEPALVGVGPDVRPVCGEHLDEYLEGASHALKRVVKSFAEYGEEAARDE